MDIASALLLLEAGDPEAGVEFNPDSAKTQRANTIATYKKIKQAGIVQGNVLDYGAGMALGSKMFGWDSYEPHPPKGARVKYRSPGSIPAGKYDTYVLMYVLNVLEPSILSYVRNHLTKLVKPGDRVIVVNRSKGDVNSLVKKGHVPDEDGGFTLPSGQYQKGWTKSDAKRFLKSIGATVTKSIDNANGAYGDIGSLDKP